MIAVHGMAELVRDYKVLQFQGQHQQFIIKNYIVSGIATAPSSLIRPEGHAVIVKAVRLGKKFEPLQKLFTEGGNINFFKRTQAPDPDHSTARGVGIADFQIIKLAADKNFFIGDNIGKCFRQGNILLNMSSEPIPLFEEKTLDFFIGRAHRTAHNDCVIVTDFYRNRAPAGADYLISQPCRKIRVRRRGH